MLRPLSALEKIRGEKQIILINDAGIWTKLRVFGSVFFAAFFSLLMLILMTLYIRAKIEKRREKEVQVIREKIREIITGALNPHFLANLIIRVNYLVAYDYELAKVYLNRVMELQRFVNQKEREFHSLKEELELVKTYIDAENARFGFKIHYEVAFKTKMTKQEQNEFILPAFVLQEPVNNAVKHAFEVFISDEDFIPKIEISIEVCGQSLFVCIKNNGSTLAQNRKEGTGTKQIRNLFALLNKFHHKKAKNNFFSIKIVDISEESDYFWSTKVEINLPKITTNSSQNATE